MARAMSAVLLQALESQAGTSLLLQKQLSAEKTKTAALERVLQQVVNVLDGARADAKSSHAAQQDLRSRLHSRDAEVADLRRVVADLRSTGVRPTTGLEKEVPFLLALCQP